MTSKGTLTLPVPIPDTGENTNYTTIKDMLGSKIKKSILNTSTNTKLNTNAIAVFATA